MAGRQRRNDTRAQIQQVALELFAEQGYEKTSLREIAERLDVTKAALYYHFKTKEDIIGSIVSDFGDAVDEVIEWGRTNPSTLENRREVLRRYAALQQGSVRDFVRFLQENQPAMRELPVFDALRERLGSLIELISDPEADLIDQFRARLAVLAAGLGEFLLRDVGAPEEDRRSAGLTVALGLVAPRSATTEK